MIPHRGKFGLLLLSILFLGSCSSSVLFLYDKHVQENWSAWERVKAHSLALKKGARLNTKLVDQSEMEDLDLSLYEKYDFVIATPLLYSYITHEKDEFQTPYFFLFEPIYSNDQSPERNPFLLQNLTILQFVKEHIEAGGSVVSFVMKDSYRFSEYRNSPLIENSSHSFHSISKDEQLEHEFIEATLGEKGNLLLVILAESKSQDILKDCSPFLFDDSFIISDIPIASYGSERQLYFFENEWGEELRWSLEYHIPKDLPKMSKKTEDMVN